MRPQRELHLAHNSNGQMCKLLRTKSLKPDEVYSQLAQVPELAQNRRNKLTWLRSLISTCRCLVTGNYVLYDIHFCISANSQWRTVRKRYANFIELDTEVQLLLLETRQALQHRRSWASICGSRIILSVALRDGASFDRLS